jgi:hypothetical protein
MDARFDDGTLVFLAILETEASMSSKFDDAAPMAVEYWLLAADRALSYTKVEVPTTLALALL